MGSNDTVWLVVVVTVAVVVLVVDVLNLREGGEGG